MRSRYNALSDYLNAQEDELDHVMISFAEIEGIIGGLPPSAYQYRKWWSHDPRYAHTRALVASQWQFAGADMVRKIARFQRTNAVVAKPKPKTGVIPPRSPQQPSDSQPFRRSYVRVGRFLDTLPVDRIQIALTFAEIGEIRGAILPSSAFKQSGWWGSQENPPVWLPAQWRIQDVFMQAQIVVFRRRGSDTLLAIKNYVRGLLEGKCGYELLPPATVLEWMRICRRIGWYFEATILYEQATHDLTALAEQDVSEIELIYAACHRVTHH